MTGLHRQQQLLVHRLRRRPGQQRRHSITDLLHPQRQLDRQRAGPAFRSGRRPGNNGTATLTDSTVSGNSAYIRGGGIDNGGSLSLTNCTVSGNSALVGGGLEIPGILTMTNTIVAGNDGRDVDGPVAPSSANNLVGDGSFMTNDHKREPGQPGWHRAVPIDPLLAPLGDYGGPTETLAPLARAARRSAREWSGPASDHRPARLRPGRLRRHRRLPEPGRGVAGRQRRDRRHGLRPGQLDLRQAINLANVQPGPARSASRRPSSPLPRRSRWTATHRAHKSGTETITGPGSNLLSISGNNASRVFLVDANVTASISGLTITDGKVPSGGGGGLDNEGGALALTNCTVSGNSAPGRRRHIQQRPHGHPDPD